MKKHFILIGAAVVVIILFGIVGYFYASKPFEKKYSSQFEPITLGIDSSISPALILLAEQEGYFAEQGLNVKVQKFASGKAAFESMLSQGTPDIVTVGHAPVMFESFRRSDFSLLASILQSEEDFYVIANKARGITKPSDLKGKKIGFTHGTTNHFLASIFLTHSGIKAADVEFVDIDVAELSQAIADGRVDVIFQIEPFATRALSLLGDNAIIFPSKGLFHGGLYLASSKEFINAHTQSLERLLSALQQAEQYMQENEAEAKKLVLESVGHSQGNEPNWEGLTFALSLNQITILTLEEMARWAIKEKLTGSSAVPNYLGYIYFSALESVKPEAVTIVH